MVVVKIGAFDICKKVLTLQVNYSEAGAGRLYQGT